MMIVGFSLLVMSFFFFFSSRRRHTRYIGDWSSDVCSSDLTIFHGSTAADHAAEHDAEHHDTLGRRHVRWRRGRPSVSSFFGGQLALSPTSRSEERRVGKEWRAGWWRIN